MRKRLALILSAAMLTVSLVGCGGGNSSNGNSAGTTKSADSGNTSDGA